MIRNVILDWSGTIVDDLAAVLEATNHVLRKAGRPPMTESEFREEFTLPAEGFYLKKLPGTAPAEMARWFHERFSQVQEQVTVLPYARAFLEFCRRRGLRVTVLTAVPEAYWRAQARTLGLDGFVEAAWASVLDKRDAIAGLLAERGWDRAETVLVGDMQHDLDAARAGGVLSCAVLSGYQRLDQLRAAAPDLVVEHVGELARVLERADLDPVRLLAPPHRAPVSTVGAAVLNGRGEVLVVRTRKWANLWGIPGGKIKYGETAEAALRRELQEETGLEVTGIRLVMVQDCVESTEFYRPEHFLLLNYVCASDGSAGVVLNDEAQEYRWVALTDASQLPLNRPTQLLFRELERQGGPGRGPSPAAPGAGQGNKPPRANHRDAMNDTIIIEDLELRLQVGVPEAERALPQRLLVHLELEHDLRAAAETDDLRRTVDYYAVTRRLLDLGHGGRSWKLIETLASDIASLVLQEFKVGAVTVEVRKFILPETRHVAVRLRRTTNVEGGAS